MEFDKKSQHHDYSSDSDTDIYADLEVWKSAGRAFLERLNSVETSASGSDELEPKDSSQTPHQDHTQSYQQPQQSKFDNLLANILNKTNDEGCDQKRMQRCLPTNKKYCTNSYNESPPSPKRASEHTPSYLSPTPSFVSLQNAKSKPFAKSKSCHSNSTSSLSSGLTAASLSASPVKLISPCDSANTSTTNIFKIWNNTEKSKNQHASLMATTSIDEKNMKKIDTDINNHQATDNGSINADQTHKPFGHHQRKSQSMIDMRSTIAQYTTKFRVQGYSGNNNESKTKHGNADSRMITFSARPNFKVKSSTSRAESSGNGLEISKLLNPPLVQHSCKVEKNGNSKRSVTPKVMRSDFIESLTKSRGDDTINPESHDTVDSGTEIIRTENNSTVASETNLKTGEPNNHDEMGEKPLEMIICTSKLETLKSADSQTTKWKPILKENVVDFSTSSIPIPEKEHYRKQ